MICPYCYGPVTIVSPERAHCVRCEMFMPSSILLEDDLPMPDNISLDDLDPRGAKCLREEIIRRAAEDFFWAWEIRRAYESIPLNRMWNEKQRYAFRQISTANRVLEEITEFVLGGDLDLLTPDYDLNTKVFMTQLRKAATGRYGAFDRAAYERVKRQTTKKGETNVQDCGRDEKGTEESNPCGGRSGKPGQAAEDVAQHGSQTPEGT